MKEETIQPEANAQLHETTRTRWQRRLTARLLPPVHTTWGMEVAPLYTPEDVQTHRLRPRPGYPGAFPFTRGVYPSMYRRRGAPFAEVIATIRPLVQAG
jgi:methylmalonyl-CoA mutase N-terminal domain/subunit